MRFSRCSLASIASDYLADRRGQGSRNLRSGVRPDTSLGYSKLSIFVGCLSHETNLVINELFSGIVFLQHTEELDDAGILGRNEQQISDLERGRTSASNLWRFVLDTPGHTRQ